MTPEERAKRATRAAFFTRLLVIVCAAIAVGAVVTLLQIRDTQIEGTPVGKKLIESSDRILDCTEGGDPTTDPPTPPGDCYTKNQRRTAKVVGDIGRYIVLAAACSATVDPEMEVNDRIAEITTCVSNRLASKP